MNYNIKSPSESDMKVDGMLKGTYSSGIKSLVPSSRFKKIKRTIKKEK